MQEESYQECPQSMVVMASGLVAPKSTVEEAAEQRRAIAADAKRRRVLLDQLPRRSRRLYHHRIKAGDDHERALALAVLKSRR